MQSISPSFFDLGALCASVFQKGTGFQKGHREFASKQTLGFGRLWFFRRGRFKVFRRCRCAGRSFGPR